MADETKTKTVIITLDASGFTKATRAAKGDAELLTKQLDLVATTLEKFQKTVAKSEDQRLTGAFNRLTQSVTSLQDAIAATGGDTKGLKDLNPQIDSLTRRFASFEVQLQRVDALLQQSGALGQLQAGFEDIVVTLKKVVNAVNAMKNASDTLFANIQSGLTLFVNLTQSLQYLEISFKSITTFFSKFGEEMFYWIKRAWDAGEMFDEIAAGIQGLGTVLKDFAGKTLPPGVLDDALAFWGKWINIAKDSISSAVTYIQSTFSNLFKDVDFSGLGLIITNTFKLAGTSIASIFNISMEAIKQTFVKGFGSLPENFSTAFDAMSKVVSEFSTFFVRQLGILFQFNSDDFINSFKDTFEKVKTVASSSLKAISNFFKNIFGKDSSTSIVDSVQKTFTQVSDVVAESFKGDTLIDKVKNTLSGLGDLFKKFLSDEGGFINIFNWGNEEKKAESAQSKIQKSIDSTARYIKALQDTTAQGPTEKQSWFEEMLFKSRVLLADFTNYVSITFNNLSKSVMDLFKRDSWFGEQLFKGRVLLADFTNYVSITFNNIVSSVKESLGKADWFQDLVFKAKVQFYDMYNFITITLKNAFNYIKEVFSDPNWLKDFIFKAKVVFYDVYNFVTITLQNAFTYIKDIFSNSEWLKDFIFKAKVVFFDVYNYVTITFNNIAKSIKDTFGNTEWMAGFLNNVKTGFSSFLSTITSALNTATNFLAQVLQNPRFLTDFVQNVKTGFETTMILLRAFGLTFMTIFNTIKPQVAEAAASIKDFVVNSEGFKFIKDNVSGIIERFSDLGLVFKVVAILMINYLQDIADKIYTTFKTLAENARASVKAFDILRTTVEAGLGAGKVEEFSATIEKVGKQFNFTTDDVTKATQAIAIFGNEIGLTSDEMQQLVTAAAAYSNTSGKDIASTAQDLVQALSGNIKSLKDYSIVIKDATLQQQGFLAAGQKFTDLDQAAQKVLVFNKIMAGLPEATKIAEAGINSTAGAADRLAVTIKNVEGKIGEGALAFTNSSIAAETLNSIIQNLDESFLKMLGYIGAVTTKITGLALTFTKWLLILGAAHTSLVGISDLLKSKNWVAKLVLDSNLPLVGQSLRSLIDKVTGGKIEIKSFGDSINLVIQVLKNMTAQLSIAIFGVNLFELSMAEAAGVVWASFVTAIKGAITFVYEFTTALLTNPIVLTVAAIAAAVYGLYKAITFIEEKTKVFSTLWAALSKGLSVVSGPFDKIKNTFSEIYDFLKDKFFKVIGVFLSLFADAISRIFEVIAIIPGISNATSNAFIKASDDLDSFVQDLKDADFDFTKLGPDEKTNKAWDDAFAKDIAAAKKHEAELKRLQEQALSVRVKAINDATNVEIVQLEKSYKKGEMLTGRYIASLENIKAVDKLKKQLLTLEDAKIGGKKSTEEFEAGLKDINIQLREIGIKAQENDLKKQFDEGKIGIDALNEGLLQVEKSKVFIQIDKLKASFDAGKTTQAQFSEGLAKSRDELIKLSAEAERSDLKNSFYEANINLKEFQIGMSKIALNEKFKNDMNELEKKRLSGVLDPVKFENDANIMIAAHQKLIKQLETIPTAPEGTLERAREEAEITKNSVLDLRKTLGDKDLLKGFTSGMQEAMAMVPPLTDSFAQLGKEAFDNLTNSLVNFTKTGKLNFEDLFNTIIEGLIKISIQQTLMKGLTSIFGPSITASAKGNAFDEKSQLIKYAKGGIVSQPTIFPFAQGTGLMGEKGAEGILPLKRTASGDLGVLATGQKGTGPAAIVNVYNNAPNTETKTEEKEGPNGERQIEIYINEMVKKNISSGNYDKTFGTIFGLARKGRT